MSVLQVTPLGGTNCPCPMCAYQHPEKSPPQLRQPETAGLRMDCSGERHAPQPKHIVRKARGNTEHLPLGVLQNSSATDRNAHTHTPAFRHCLCGNVWSWDFFSTLRNMSKPGCGVHVLLELVTSAMRTSLSFPNSYTKPAIGTTVALHFPKENRLD